MQLTIPGPTVTVCSSIYSISLLLLALIASLAYTTAAAAESKPPLLTDGELFEDHHQLINNISKNALVLSVAFSPDGALLASGSEDNSVRLWSVAEAREVARLEGHGAPVLSVAFSPDGALLASGSEDNSVRLWSVAEAREVARLEGHGAPVLSVAFSPDGALLASGSDDNSVRLWSVAEAREVARLEGHGALVWSVAFSPDGALLASGSEDNSVRLWSVAEAREVARLEGHGAPVWSVAFSPDGALLASGSEDNSVRLWSVAEAREVARLEGHGDWVLSVAFSPDGALLASGSEDNSVRLWSVAEAREVARLEGHGAPVLSVAFSPDGALLASGSEDNSVRLWSVAEAREVARLEGHGAPVWSVAFSPDGALLASGSEDNSVRLWSVAEAREVARLEGHGAPVLSVAFSPDGALLASGSSDNSVRLWSVAEAREVARLEGHGAPVLSVAFSPDGALLASGSSDNSVRLWSVAEAREVARLEGHGAPVWSVAFSPDGALLASGSSDNSVRLWSVAEAREVARLEGHGAPVWSVAFSPDGALLASGSSDNSVRLWSVAEAREVARLEGHGAPVWSVAFSPDGALLASGSSDNSVRLWSVAEAREVARLEGHGAPVWSVAFSPDGALLASGSWDIRLWDWQEEKQLGSFMGGQRGAWVTCNAEGRCWRYDDGTLLMHKKDHRLSPVPPKQSTDPSDLELVGDPPNQLAATAGTGADLVLRIKNNGQNPDYWIRPYQDIVYDKVNKNPLVFHLPPIQVVLNPGEVAEFSAHVSARGDYNNPEGKKANLKLNIASARGDPLSLEIPVQVITPVASFDGAMLALNDNNQLQVNLKNIGQQDLQQVSYEARLSDAEEPLGTFERNELKAGTAARLAFPLDDDRVLKNGVDLLQENLFARLWRHLKKLVIEPDESNDTRLNLTVRKLSYPPHRWEFPNLAIAEPRPALHLYGGGIFMLLVSLIMVYYLRLYRHPLVQGPTSDPAALLDLALDRLPVARRLLTRARRLNTVMSKAGIKIQRLDDAIAFYEDADPERRCRQLAARLDAAYESIPHDRLAAFKLQLPDAFILNLQHCVVVFPEANENADETAAALRHLRAAGSPVLMLISTDPEQQRALRQRAAGDRVRMWVIPDSRDLSRLLLSPEPLEAFARLLAAQVKITRISPYQTRGGVNKDTVFFGRAQLLADITGGAPANHLIVGGRQVGKSSLLKAIDRHYANDPQVGCHYLSVGRSALQAALAPSLKLPPGSGMDDVLAALRQPEPGRRRLLLIDEADVFLKNEAGGDYSILNEFRNLSEQGLCHFIFAGFWNLYYAVSQDYQSPLKNFGATHIIGALEPAACRDLITKPMATLNLYYEPVESVERIVHETGGRANLMAIACNAILKHLDPGSRTIDAQDVERALDDNDIRDALGGWQRLGDDEASGRMDQIVVYATVGLNAFTLGELIGLLDDKGCAYDLEQLKTSLLRLELAFILGRERDRYSYRVPLFQAMIRSLEPERSLVGLIG